MKLTAMLSICGVSRKPKMFMSPMRTVSLCSSIHKNLVDYSPGKIYWGMDAKFFYCKSLEYPCFDVGGEMCSVDRFSKEDWTTPTESTGGNTFLFDWYKNYRGIPTDKRVSQY